MINYIKGKVTYAQPGKLVLESNGIGFEINVGENCSCLPVSPEEEVCIYTYLSVKEDDLSLWGFTDRDSLQMFMMLIGVSGVGCKGAMSVLSTLSAADLKKAIMFEDVAAISRANGIGKKTAAKMVLELKDKVGKLNFSRQSAFINKPEKQNDNKDKAAAALIALGFSKYEAADRLSGAGDDLSTEEYIRLALKDR